MEDTKIGAIKLIRDEFPGTTINEFKALTSLDKQQLGSAIARSKNMDVTELQFALVDY